VLSLEHTCLKALTQHSNYPQDVKRRSVKVIIFYVQKRARHMTTIRIQRMDMKNYTGVGRDQGAA
jgi:hypothetical protein